MREFEHGPLSVTILVTSYEQLASVYALLGGASRSAVAAAAPKAEIAERASPATSKPSATVETQDSESPASAGTGETATTDASPSEDVKVDAAGTPFDPARHTGTFVKSGLWRMKAGIARGPGEGEDAIPGNSENGTGTANNGPASTAEAGPAGEAATSPAANEEEDEFAAFTKATANEPVEIPARTWTDADLSALCAQAATKLGDPAPVKAIIANYTPEGETPHSRNVPADDRTAFAAEVEKAAGITYAG